MNKNIAILDGSWGDNAKGHLAHAFSSDFDYVIKCNGGNNAGHTIYRNGKKYVHHLVPSIDFTTPHIKGFLASGMVIDLEALFNELLLLEKDFSGVSKRITVDPDAFVVLQKHIEEDKAKNGHIGTTNRGIGPAYLDKMARSGTKVRDLIKNNSIVIGALKDIGVKFKCVLELKEEFSKSKILFEGAQGVLLDINHGTYPYVSCSDCTVGGIFSSGFGFAMPSKVYGLQKAYSTRVGNGPFPTELKNKEGERLRELGQEFGSTSGRARRTGWIDLPAIKYAIQKGGITDLIITKLDIFNGYEKVPICFRYKKAPMSGTDFFDTDISLMEVKGWKNCKDYEQIKEFIHTIEYFTETKVSHVSCGTDKLDILKL